MDDKLAEERARVSEGLDPSFLQREIQEHCERVERSLDDDSEDWKVILPGRQILLQFVHQARLDSARAKRLYIRRSREVERNPFEEIETIFRDFSEF